MQSHPHPRPPLPASFAAFLRDGIAARVAAQGSVLREGEAVLDCIQAVLERPRLDPGEEAEIACHARDDNALERKDAWIAARVARALTAGLEAAALRCTPALTFAPARVLVRGSRTATVRRAGSLEGVQGGEDSWRDLDASLAQDPGASIVLVLADAPELERIATHLCLPPANASQAIQLCDLAFAVRHLRRVMLQVLEPEEADPVLGATALLAAHAANGSADSQVLEPGLLFHGKYRIVRLVGKGGFGTVYEALDERVGSRVAIKMLNAPIAQDDAELEQFVAEAKRLSRLEHPNIVGWKVFDEDEEGRRYLVMELLEGEELADVFRREKRLAPKRVARILLQVLDALRAAHLSTGSGAILHLDLKPKNVFLLPPGPGSDEERVKVIDFGVGQLIGGVPVDPLPAVSEQEIDAAANGSAQRRDAGTIGETIRVVREPSASEDSKRLAACTPEYASPELCSHLLEHVKAERLDGRADLYSLGVLGFQMLTGELPFPAPSDRLEYLRLHRDAKPRRVRDSNPRVPRSLARFIERCLRRLPADRWRDAQEAYRSLHRIVHPSPVVVGAQFLAPLLLLGSWGLWVLWPGAGGRAFDLYATIDGVEQLVAKDGLWLGPARRSASLRLSGASCSTAAARISLQDSMDLDAPPLDGWTAAAEDERHVSIGRRPSAAEYGGTAYLRLQVDGQSARFSAPFELHWIASNAWEIASVEVQGQGSRALDPEGQSLDVTVRGACDAIAGVVIEHGDRRMEAAILPASRPEERVYGAPLSELGWTEGLNTVRVIVTDRAGMQRRIDEQLDLALAPLGFTRARLSGERIGGKYSLSPVVPVRLQVELNRPAQLAWRVLDATDRELAGGTCANAAACADALPDFRRLGAGRDFSGTVVLRADESAAVAHSVQERGRAELVLPFVFNAGAPSLALSLTTAERQEPLELEGGAERFVSARSARLTVTPLNPVPIEVELRIDGPGPRVELPRRRFTDPALSSTTYELALHDDGVYRLSVRAYRVAGDAGVAELPEFESTARLAVDTTPARIVAEPSTVVLGAESPAPVAVLSLQDIAGDRPAAPVALRWELARIDGRPQVVRQGELDPRIAVGERRRLELPLPWADAADRTTRDLDGRYVVTFSGVDAAGNTATSAQIACEIALRGPSLKLRSPTAGLAWTAGESGAFEIELQAEDPNGTAAVAGELRRLADDGHAIAFVLECGPKQADDTGLWHGRIPLDPSWSEADVVVRFEARDGRGSRSEQRFERRLGAIERHHPEVVAPVLEGAGASPMAFVRGNRAAPYEFGGRADVDEERAFRQARLDPWRTNQMSRSWQAHFAPGTIPDYYLDRSEVSAGALLAFVRDRAAWNKAELWPAGAPPGEARRLELERSLAAVSAGMPATGMTWAEAAAYARCVGKRLPSIVEWEYAVRGGVLYRPYSCCGTEGRPVVAAAAPMPVGQSSDVTASGSLHDLCGNVSEWTSTPAWFPDGRTVPGNPALHVEQWRAQFLDARSLPGWDAAEHYWVVGGGWRSSRFHFFVVDRRMRDRAGDAVGFRCAASAEDVLQAMEDPRAPVRFVEVIR